jgi:hypothetical protein
VENKLKKILTTLAISALTLATSASAAIFEYSYTYNNGNTVSGTFSGDLNGDYIGSVSNITVLSNGVPLTDKPYYIAGLGAEDSGLVPTGWRLSPIQSLNSFAFTNSPNVRDYGWDTFFVFDGNLSTGNWGSNSAYGFAPYYEGGQRMLAADRPVNNSFRLGEISTSGNSEVPEPGTILLLAVALASLFIVRRAAHNA